ncbi:MAG TPA: gas vesicle protein GvpG [Deltaproteobacteria bacterium]|nr:MAG: gas vesicle protein GvpG [Deltaproteobacteria bacterium GWA2_55_82]OGQ63511.1 MAG: gas vesicle protein GvpG [Deltaproteobacteria bacterium RIFCSPLOWO2_02_FULL_55_12]OIJ74892.1 MAG: gas vesicle protein GvpG [Deltaproteobacteria bacterium GWC2_55_46]HBG47456.1 gas vesicle protein GvpG [Deltaproteobacteria bacterium]HCY11472.1 gas vesicle protein GvpG [Deltaproteobacteria bacterium]
MGFLLDDIILFPVKGVAWIGQRLKQAADDEMLDSSKVQGELMELQIQFELGAISEEEYARREGELLERLEEIKRLKERASGGE